MKVPATPPATFTTEPRHLRSYDGLLWRIYRTEGAHALDWDELRHFGPVKKMRFDPHPEPAGVHPDAGVMYAATDALTAFGEVYQGRRVITRSEGRPSLVAWAPSRALTLLDLTGNWPVMNGAAAAMMMDNKRHTRAWAHAIWDRLGVDVDGLWHASSITNQPMVTLFSRTETVPAFPARPRFHVPLSDAGADDIVDLATRELKFKSLK